ncbi:MAG: DUF2807 domain-containing protein [Acidobacteria bacterium]|nr:DUF2807 domain-containing protein [Acidobacteriota bacterium]
MKKFGILVLIGAVMLGVVLANSISYGKVTLGDVFSFRSGIKGSGNVVSESRNSSSFTSVKVSGVFDVKIVVGSTQSISVEAEDNLLPFIETEVDGENLTIRSSKNLKPTRPMKILISVQNIEHLKTSGASSVSVESVNNSSLTVDVSGASKAVFSGTTGELNIEVSGASNINTADLLSQNATVDASGASKASVNSAQSLKAKSSGASSIRYSGSPGNIEVKRSGAGSIEPAQ